MKIVIPTSVDVKAMVAGLNVSPTKAKGFEMRINYFLSQVMTTNENWKINKDNNFYRNICSEVMKQIIGDDYYDIVDLLMSKTNPVVECDELYCNLPDIKPKCKGYRLTSQYNTGEYVYRQLPAKFTSKVLKYLPEDAESIRMTKHYSFLIEQYHIHQMGINPSVYDYISNFGQELVQCVDDDNYYQKHLIYNLIGRWLFDVQKLEDGELNPMVAGSNHRVNSVFTNLPKVLRGFVECSGKPLYSIDLSASQPYILSKVMDNSFIEGVGYGFNLCTIYRDVYNKLNNSGLIKSYFFNPISGRYPFMWGEFFFPNEVQSIVEFQEIPFKNDFYKYVISKGISNPLKEDEFLKMRKEFKDKMMYILFSDKKGFRKYDDQIKMFSKAFRGVNKWLELSHRVIGKREFALVMQRCESWLLIHNVCRQFLNQQTEIPLFTIHDGLFSYKEYTQDIANLIVTTCREFIGVEPGLKIEPPRTEIYPRRQDVDDEWVEIKPIDSEERFEKVKGGVFKSNIERGLDFITNYQKSESYQNAA
jgi:hypothetical protein